MNKWSEKLRHKRIKEFIQRQTPCSVRHMCARGFKRTSLKASLKAMMDAGVIERTKCGRHYLYHFPSSSASHTAEQQLPLL